MSNDNTPTIRNPAQFADDIERLTAAQLQWDQLSTACGWAQHDLSIVGKLRTPSSGSGDVQLTTDLFRHISSDEHANLMLMLKSAQQRIINDLGEKMLRKYGVMFGGVNYK